MNKEMKKVCLICILCSSIFVFFLLRTESRYKAYPIGDAAFYTLMAVHYNSPNVIHPPLPVFYSKRLLPSLLVGLMTSPFIEKNRITDLSNSDMLMLDKYRSIHAPIRKGYLVLNLVAHILTVLFLYITLSRLGVSQVLSVGLSLLFMTFFIPVRLYICWPQMADPLGFMFMAMMFYFLITSSWKSFLAVSIPAVITRENTLFLVPCFWIALIYHRSMRLQNKLLLILVSLMPIAVFLYLQLHPYFPSVAHYPNTNSPIPLSDSLIKIIGFDYIYLIFYHLRTIFHNGMYLSLLLMPFYVFGPLSFVFFKVGIWKSFLKKYFYLAPWVFINFFLGLVIDRQMFYLFPLVFSVAGLVIQKLLRAPPKQAVFIISIFLLNMYLYDGWTVVNQQNILFSDWHQLEFVFEKKGILFLFIKTLKVGAWMFLSLWFLNKNTFGLPIRWRKNMERCNGRYYT